MSLSPLRIAVLVVALAAVPLIASCGQTDDGQAFEGEEEIAQEIDQYLTQADLKPVDQTEVDDQASDDEGTGEVRQIDVDPS